MQTPEPCLPEISSHWLWGGAGNLYSLKAADHADRTPRRRLTFVIFPPLKLAKRLRERVKTLDVLWMVKRLLAGTFFLHL